MLTWILALTGHPFLAALSFADNLVEKAYPKKEIVCQNTQIKRFWDWAFPYHYGEKLNREQAIYLWNKHRGDKYFTIREDTSFEESIEMMVECFKCVHSYPN